MTEFVTKFPWFAIAIALSAALSCLAWHIVTRNEPVSVRRWTGIALATLFVLYYPLSWFPAGYILGLGVGLARRFGVPTGSIYLFAIASIIASGVIAWALAHLIKRLIKKSCDFVPHKA